MCVRVSIIVFASSFALCASAQADPVHDALEDYALYQNDVSTLLEADINARSVDAALARVSRHSPAAVARGWIAYGALTAAQSPEFVASIQRSVRQDGRAPVLSQLQTEPGFARRQNGGDQAIHLILAAAGADGARAEDAGDRYDRYARQALPNVQLVSSVYYADLGGGTRLTQAARDRLNIGPLGARPANDAEAFGGPEFWDSLANRSARSASVNRGREEPTYASITDHMLTLSALVIADAADSPQASELLDEPLTRDCLHMQQLQLRQCLSVSHDPGERAYCMGHHALEGPGACFANVAR
jgi:hypothetical protein